MTRLDVRPEPFESARQGGIVEYRRGSVAASFVGCSVFAGSGNAEVPAASQEANS